MTLVLSTDDAQKVLDLTSVIERLEQTYAELGSGSAVYRGRTDLFHPTQAAIGADMPTDLQFDKIS